MFKELGDPIALSNLDKTYFPGYRDTRQVESFLADGMQYYNRPSPALDSGRQHCVVRLSIWPVSLFTTTTLSCLAGTRVLVWKSFSG